MPGGNSVKITDEDRREVSGRELSEEIGLDAREIRWRKEFARFRDDDVERLEEMEELCERCADDLVEEFYDHLQSYSETIAILDSSTKPVAALKRSQKEYLKDLGRGNYGREYFNKRTRIGKIHDMLDLGPKFYLGAYSVYYDGILSAIAEDVKQETTRADGGAVVGEEAEPENEYGQHITPVEDAVDTVVDRALSMLKIMLIDQQIAMDTYIHSYSQEVTAEVERQQTIASEVETAVNEIDTASGDVARRSQGISDAAADQSEAMESVSSEVANMSATIEEIASTADEVKTTSARAATRAEEGVDSAQDALSAMDEISDSATTVTDDMDTLQGRVDQIDDIVDVINDIAEQTNMLALNASIEAARAGDAGQGFAVVADEVKSLAEESKGNATEIESLIDEIQSDTTETVESLDTMVEQVKTSTVDVEEAMENLMDVAEAVEDTSNGINEVASATDDQAASAEEVASQVDQAVQQTSDVARQIEEIATANEEVAQQITELQQSVSRLTSSKADEQ